MKKKQLWKLFISTFHLSAFTFGGGYVIVTLMRKKFVDEYHWIEEDEMLDLVAIAQSSPGAIAVNGAIVIGYKLAGIIGVVISVLAAILPPFFIITLVSSFYAFFKDNPLVAAMLEGMQAGVGAVITAVVFEMGAGILKEKNILYLLIMLCSFVATYVFNINVVFVILLCMLIGIIKTYLEKRFVQ